MTKFVIGFVMFFGTLWGVPYVVYRIHDNWWGMFPLSITSMIVGAVGLYILSGSAYSLLEKE